MAKRRTPNEQGRPFFHRDHRRPRTRREFLAQGFIAGSAYVVAPSVLSLLGVNRANAQASCALTGAGAGKIPFIGIDLAGGANIAGSNVMIGGPGGQEDPLNEQGYAKLGLPLDMTPLNSQLATAFDRTMNLVFHFDSAMLAGILSKASPATLAKVEGIIISARSANDTQNNPLNPIYGVYTAGADGGLLSLVGTQSSDSGGNSVMPMSMFDPSVRPTKIDRPSDVRGLVDTGKLTDLLGSTGAGNVASAIQAISSLKVEQIQEDQAVKDLVNCAYQQSSDLITLFGDPAALDPEQDPLIVNPNQANDATRIFTQAELTQSEFRKTASVMKLVLEGHAGAGTIEFGGYDYHDGSRTTGEAKDFRAGQAIGAIFEYAERNPLVGDVMVYLFSDGSVFSDGQADNGANGKFVWRGDNSGSGVSVMMVYRKSGKPTLRNPFATTRQIGFYQPNGDVTTGVNSVANNPEALTQAAILNYMALHGEEGQFSTLFPGNAIQSDMANLLAFTQIR
ncbi:general secretion pathway protein GspF [Myxococcota bacterium]|nr:general secretion pathway protein GspF [Myxococcota bacterium]